MAKYSIEDFSIGDEVYHLSNSSLKMVVIETRNQENEIVVRWLDKAGNKQISSFMSQELGKSDDLRPRIRMINI